MLVGCPKCRTRYRLDDSRIPTEGSVLRCSRCRALFRIAGKRKAEPSSPDSVPRERPGNSVVVLVANESPDFCRAVERTLASEPFTILCRHDGQETLDVIEELRPDVVVLDVALPTVYGFQICDRIRNTPALSSVKTILIASIYDKTKYKREPQSLYGADDYIEKHHIPDSLAAKIYRLVFGQKAVEPAEHTDSAAMENGEADSRNLSSREMSEQEEVREQIRLDEEVKTSADGAVSSEAHDKARRLARIIVGDIALYNQKKVEEGIRCGTFRELLRDEIAEGEKLYMRRVPEEVRNGTSYLQEAFDDFLAQKRSELSGVSEG
ncbi:MAG: response regulator [Geobacteraceae bacterium]|nr:response regulator [Geobacteraceae bacterium]